MFNKKYFVKILVLSIFLFCINSCAQEKSLEEIAKEIHEKILTIDTHTDTPLRIDRGNFNVGEKNDARLTGSKVDFPRMKEGGLDAIFFAAFVAQAERTESGYKKAKERVIQLIELTKKVVSENSELSELAFTPDDAYRIEKTGKRAVYIGIENGYAIGKNIKLIKEFYDMGVRYITLCHSKNNDICDSSTDENGAEHNGLSKFGEEVVKEMNRIGMLIDISHLSDSSIADVLRISKAPVIASHSSVYSVCNHPRNINDDLLLKLKENGGVLQICLFTGYIKTWESYPEREEALKELRKKYNNFENLTKEEEQKAVEEWNEIEIKFPPKMAGVKELVDHIDYVVKLIGVDYVGIGSDFDGGGGLKDCYDVSEMLNITIELIKRGYTEDDIRKIWGGNFMRVFNQVQEFARENSGN